MIGKITQKYQDHIYLIFRVLTGVLFLQHGVQKFGLLGGQAVPLAGMFGVAGLVEVLVGLALVVGVLTRLAALGGAIQMLVAYFMVHAPKGTLPINNGGELALLFFTAFLVVLVHGAKKWGLELVLRKKEIF